MALQLYDSLERKLKPVVAHQPDGVVRFYNCGPTVYAPAHIGNFRTFVINDVIRRMLELEFGKDRVRHVRNLTDVDDRTIGQARKENRPLADITREWTRIFHEDCAALNCLPPHAEPTATGYIREQVNLIEVLMQKGHAYRAADGSVYFKLASFPDYGRLSRIKERELKVTNTVADADHKDSVSDFALWKAWKPDEDGDVKWPGPRGAAEGRPGWHIECSAMNQALLGETIDLHTGGVDLLFPHHENEIAQSQCGNGAVLSHHWYHSEHLLVDGATMSKSKGNYYTLGDLLAKGYSPMAVRYALLAGHPRKQLNFTIDGLHSAEQALKQIKERIRELGASGNALFNRAELETVLSGEDRNNWGSFSPAQEKICDDLNLPAAIGSAFTAFHNLTEHTFGAKLAPLEYQVEFLAAVRFFQDALGIELDLETEEEREKHSEPAVPHTIHQIAEERWAARTAKDWATADALRKELAAAGWSMLDGKDGYQLQPLKR